MTSATAWVTVVLLGAQASLGFLRVRALLASGSSAFPARAWVLAAHVVLGVMLPPLALAHGRLSMKLPGIRATSAPGLWIATAALLLLAVQAVTGMSMLQMKEPQRTGNRPLHLATAVILLVLAGAHVFLNG